MKKLLLFLGLIIFAFALSAQQKFFVAPDGSDSNSGTITYPFKTIDAALKKVAQTKANQVFIYLRGGRYSLSQTLEITPQIINNHQLVISNYNNEKVVFTGSVRIEPKWEIYKGKILQTQLEKNLSIDQLLCNGLPLNMARYPNYDKNARVFNGTAADAISKARIRKWENPAGGYVHALHNAEWGDFHYIIKEKINDSLVLEGGWQNNRPAPMHRQHRFVENIFEELDTSGEWYYNNKTGVLYVYPLNGTDLRTAVLERTVVNDIISIKGEEANPVKNVTISGIIFTGANRTFMLKEEPLLRTDWTIHRGGAILTEGAENITISNCVFTSLGGNAVFVSKYNRNINCEQNHVYNIGGNAFAFIGDAGSVRSPSFRYEQFVPIDKMDMTPGPKTNNYPADCKVYDNLVHDIGTVEKQIAGVEIDIAMNITVSHNSIYNTPRAGINIGDGCFGGHMVEYNDVFNTVLETGDHGAFNSWGRDRFWLPGITDVDKLVEQYPQLPLLDVIKPITIRNNRFQCEHGWDIDLDDGSSNYHIYNNLCLNGGLKLREGFYRKVWNNILVNNTFHPHVWYAKSEDEFMHNIVTTEYAPIRVFNWGKLVDSNFFIQNDALSAAQKNNTDKNSLQGDPQFVNQSAGDFRVKSTSKAIRIGFQNFPMNQFGVVSTALKQKVSTPKITPVRTLQAEKKGETTQWIGAVIKNIETLGEQSASGLPDKNGVLIVSVSPNSLAAKSGLSAGDAIYSINGKQIANVSDMLTTLQAVMWQGQAYAGIWHNQQKKSLVVYLK